MLLYSTDGVLYSVHTTHTRLRHLVPRSLIGEAAWSGEHPRLEQSHRRSAAPDPSPWAAQA